MRKTGPVCRFCRREGEKLYLKGARCESPKCPITRGQAYPPGVHGPKGQKGKKSEYARQLREKQKAKIVFGLSERQFSNYYQFAVKSKVTGQALMEMLEKRLDNVLYRSGIATSRPHARQLVQHGSCKINGNVVSIPSYRVKIGDKFEVTEKMKENAHLNDSKGKKDTSPGWMKVDLKSLSGEVIKEPTTEDFEKNIATNLIVEFYSK